MKRLTVLAALGLLCACDLADMQARVTGRAAQSVVVNVLANQYPQAAAEAAADCVVSNAAPAEAAALARDVGTRAGTSTVATIRSIADRPGTVRCLAARGLAPVAVVP
jgi:hypothetical protein